METLQLVFLAAATGAAFGTFFAHSFFMWRTKRRMMKGMQKKRAEAEERLQKSREKVAKNRAGLSKPPKRIKKG